MPSHNSLATTSVACFFTFVLFHLVSLATSTTHTLCRRPICHVKRSRATSLATEAPSPPLPFVPRVYGRVNRRSTRVFAHGDARIAGVRFRHDTRLCVAKRATRVQHRSRGARCAPEEVRHAERRRRRCGRKPKLVHGEVNCELTNGETHVQRCQRIHRDRGRARHGALRTLKVQFFVNASFYGSRAVVSFPFASAGLQRRQHSRCIEHPFRTFLQRCTCGRSSGTLRSKPIRRLPLYVQPTKSEWMCHVGKKGTRCETCWDVRCASDGTARLTRKLFGASHLGLAPGTILRNKVC